MVNVSSRELIHSGNNSIVGWFPQALETFTASVELGVKVRPKWLSQAAVCH